MKFSILIPTKDRLDLLKYAVKSILKQTYQNYEIVISDNNSEQDIACWLEQLKDERIKYFRQSKSITVTENWNSANNMSTGDYIIMLGDDDALLPDSLQSLFEYIQLFNSPELIEFPAYLYLQPNVDPIDKDGNVQISPILFRDKIADFISLEERQVAVKKCFHFNYVFGFNMQYFCYSKELVKKLQQYGNFYEPPYPDYYTACMMMLVADTVLHIPKKITIIGITRKSYGYYFRNNIEKEGMKFHKEVDYRRYAPTSIRNKLCSVDEIHTAAIATFSLIPMRIDFDKPDLVNYYKQVITRELRNRDFPKSFQIIKKEMLPHLSYCERIEVLRYTLDVLRKMDTIDELHEIPIDKNLSYPNILEVIENIESIEYFVRNLAVKKLVFEQQRFYMQLERIRVDAFYQNLMRRDVLIWGAYDRGRLVKEFLESKNINVAGFIDNNTNIKEYLDLPVWPPEKIRGNRNKYYIMIPLRTLLFEIIDLLENENYQYMTDYYYINYNKEVSIHNYIDLFNNKIKSESEKVNFDVLFYGYECEIEVSDGFENYKDLLATLHGNDVKLYFKDNINIITKNKDLQLIKVEYGNNVKTEINIEIIEHLEQSAKIALINGYILVFSPDNLLATFENSMIN